MPVPVPDKSVHDQEGKPNIISADDAAALEDVDCIMVLGCSVRPDGTPSGMLRDRLDKGIELYEDGVSDRLLMSGDMGARTMTR